MHWGDWLLPLIQGGFTCALCPSVILCAPGYTATINMKTSATLIFHTYRPVRRQTAAALVHITGSDRAQVGKGGGL